MKMGLRLHDSIKGTLAERLAFAKEQGFECAHLALSKVLPDFQMADAPEKLARAEFAGEIRMPFERTGLDLALLGCYMSLMDRDQEQVERIRKIYDAHIVFSKQVGAWMVGSETPAGSGSTFSKDAATSEDALKIFIERLRPVVRKAEEEDVIFAIEPVFRHVVSTPERAERVLDAIRSDHLRIIFDAVNLLSPENACRRDEVIADGLRRLGDRVVLLHMKDYRLEADGSMPAMACGTGEMDYGTLMRFARERDLSMTLENTKPENAVAAREFLARS